jgi:hypothetical protein
VRLDAEQHEDALASDARQDHEHDERERCQNDDLEKAADRRARRRPRRHHRREREADRTQDQQPVEQPDEAGRDEVVEGEVEERAQESLLLHAIPPAHALHRDVSGVKTSVAIVLVR